MERPSGAELRIRRQANKTFVLRTHAGEQALGSPLQHNETSRGDAETRRCGVMKGGNGESVANEVTLRRATGVNPWA